MGTNIHMYAEERINGVWKDRNLFEIRLGDAEDGSQDRYHINMLDIGRDYLLFSVLADVRNRYGVQPICSPKGLPSDCSRIIRQIAGDIDGEVYSDASWLTLTELVDAKNSDLNVGHDGIPHKDGEGVLDYLYQVVMSHFFRVHALVHELELPEKSDDLRVVFWFEC